MSWGLSRKNLLFENYQKPTCRTPLWKIADEERIPRRKIYSAAAAFWKQERNNKNFPKTNIVDFCLNYSDEKNNKL